MKIFAHKGSGYIELRQSVANLNTLEIYLYGDIEGDWEDWFGNIHEGNGCERLRDELENHPEVTQIDIFINSYGGDVFEGTAMYNLLKRHHARKTVYIDGFACSIASVIAMAGDEVVMPPNTMMMIHDMWRVAIGNARELRKAADDLDVINAAGRQAYLIKAGEKLSEEKLMELMEKETWLTAADCVELGLADRLTETDADMNYASAMLNEKTEAFSKRLERQQKIAASLRELAALPDPAKGKLERDGAPKTLLQTLAGAGTD